MSGNYFLLRPIASAVLLLLLSISSYAQAPAPAPKNLQVLSADVNIPKVMRSFSSALGVPCAYCHAAANRDYPRLIGEIADRALARYA